MPFSGSLFHVPLQLRLGAEGGTFAIVRQRNQRGTWEYCCIRDETTISDLLQEGESENGDGLFKQSAHLGEFEDALLHLDEYPWFRLFPLKVHAEFADIVLKEVEKKGRKDAAVEWTERLESHRP